MRGKPSIISTASACSAGSSVIKCEEGSTTPCFTCLRSPFWKAEMSLSSYTVSLLRDAPFIAIPVFPSRMFRHSSIYVNAKSGIETPQDLIGKKN